LKTARIYKNTYLLSPHKSDVNLKTGQSVDEDILLWSLYSTLLLYGFNHGKISVLIESINLHC
jgi:hypothetical protein